MSIVLNTSDVPSQKGCQKLTQHLGLENGLHPKLAKSAKRAKSLGMSRRHTSVKSCSIEQRHALTTCIDNVTIAQPRTHTSMFW